MNAPNHFESRLRERLAASDESRRSQRDRLTQEMNHLDERLKRYTALADYLMKAVILPRVGKLLECFTAAPPPKVEQTRHNLVCRFPHSDRFPATAVLELGVTRDGDAHNVALEHSHHIVPALVPVNAESHLVLPLDAVDEAKVASWVEERLLAFVDAFLKVEAADPYQQDNMVTDPVCGMRINKLHAAAEVEYHGVKYHFCAEQCRRAFEESPERYLTGRPEGAT
jgi:YHS domain-containing protein